MSYSDIYRKRIGIRGTSRIERNFEAKKRSFNKYFENALNKHLVTIDGVEQYAVFQDQNQNNNKDLSDDKYIVVPLESNMEVGSLINWGDKIWMVFTEENKTIKSHKQGKIKASNHYVKWMNGSKVSGNGNGVPAFIQNQTLYTLGISTSGNHSWIVNAKMMMYLQDNDETRSLKIGQRIFIGGAVYQVMFRDYVSRNGLINFLLEEDFVNAERDDIENEIADYYTVVENNPDQEVAGTSKEVAINGSTNARIGSLVKYEAVVFADGEETQEEISEWTVADVDHVATVVEQTPRYMTLRIENNFQKVGSTISVIGKTADGVIGAKTVNIISLY
ncbi:hypothetical protein MOE90_20680 [Bacillus spizizenii]|nr:hypothetical protein [Bacillus spizizenii]MCY9124886.1 hypothetical protein [Bacillus spizizenii]